jgi:hypothetical protein
MRPEASAARPGTTPLTREAGEVENAAGKLAAGPASTDRGRRRQRLRCKTLFALRPGRPAPMHRRWPRSRLCDRRRREHSRRSESPRATIACRASVKPKSSGPTPTEKTSTFIPDRRLRRAGRRPNVRIIDEGEKMCVERSCMTGKTGRKTNETARIRSCAALTALIGLI